VLDEFPGINQDQYAILLSLKCSFRLVVEVVLDTGSGGLQDTNTLEERRLTISEK